MKNKFTKIIALGLTVLTTVGLTGCSEADRTGLFDYTQMEVNELDNIDKTALNNLLVKSGYLTVGTSPDYAPYSFLDSELKGLSKVQGAESAVAFYVAKSLGLELEFKTVGFDLLTSQLENDSIDVIFSGLTHSEEREKNYKFTDTYYQTGDGGQVLLVNVNNDSKYTSVEDINKSTVKIGAQLGSVQDGLVTSQLSSATPEYRTDTAQLVVELNNGNIDLMASSYTAALSIIKSNPNLMILSAFEFEVEDEGTMGLLKKDNDLVTYLNLAIATLDYDTYELWLDEFYKYAAAISIEF